MEKNKRGPYHGGKYKSAVIMLRVSLEEKAAWTAVAAQWGGPLSAWLRTGAEHFMRDCEDKWARAKTNTTKKGGR